MLLRSSPRCAPWRRASLLLLLAAVLLCVVSVSASLPAHRRCPSRIDCAKQGRHYCQPGSSYCGSCLSPFQENEEGRCVQAKHRQRVTSYSNLDEEIDFLHSIIEKQEVSEMKTTKQQTKHRAAITSLLAAKLTQKNQSTTTAASQTAATDPPNTESTPQPRVTGGDGRAGPIAVKNPKNDNVIVFVISLCVVVGTVAVILATVCYIKLQKESQLAEKVDYPAFKRAGMPPVTANGTSMGDKTLAQNAQMYHYQHQKQQMLSMETHKPEQKTIDTDVTSDEEEVGGDFTVYECPGLAPTGEMEVKNPLFDDSAIHYQENHK